MFEVRHLAFHNCLRIVSSNQFSPVDIFLEIYGDILSNMGTYSVTLLGKTVRFVACTCGNSFY